MEVLDDVELVVVRNDSLITSLVAINHHVTVTADNGVDTHRLKVVTVSLVCLVLKTIQVVVRDYTVVVSANHPRVRTCVLADKYVGNVCCRRNRNLLATDRVNQVRPEYTGLLATVVFIRQ